MFKTVAKTVVFYIFIILGATFAMYLLLWAAPGDLRDVLCPKGCSQERLQEIAREWNLDKPLPVQYYLWLKKAVRFEFGTSVSLSQGAPVGEMLKRAATLTTSLVLGASLLTLLFSLFLNWRPQKRRYRWLLKIFQAPLSLLSFVPLYVLAYFLVMASSRIPHWLAESGIIAKKTYYHWLDIEFIPFGQELEWTNELGWLFLVPFILSMVLLAIGNNNLVEQAAALESEIEQLKKKDFIRAAISRGASVFRHLFKNLLLPLIQFFTARSILLLGTVVIIESIMGITGIGWLLWEATKLRDTPVVLAIALFATILSSLLQMFNELALKLIDPRLRRE